MALARRIVMAWVRLYTLGLSEAVRSRRIEELESDVWEQGVAGRDRPALPTAAHVLWRVLAGMAADIGWRRTMASRDRSSGSTAHPRLAALLRRVFSCMAGVYSVFAAMAVVAPDPGLVGWSTAEQVTVLLAIALMTLGAVVTVRRSVALSLLCAVPAVLGLAIHARVLANLRMLLVVWVVAVVTAPLRPEGDGAADGGHVVA